MKLHLPIKLFRAVMALFTAHALITATWADGTTPIDTESTVKTVELEADTEYSAWEGILFPNEGGTTQHIITTKEGIDPVSVSFSNASNSALHAEQITLKNLKDITFDSIVLEDDWVVIGGAMDSAALGNSVVTIENNAKVTFTDNKAIVTVGGSAEGAVVRADNIYLRDNESITMTGNVSYTKDGDCIGGAMSSGGGDFELSGSRGNIDISNNSAISGSNHRALGGAILAVDMVGEGNFGGTITISSNSGDTISIKENTVETGEDTPQYGNNNPKVYIAVGGALLAMQNVDISYNTASLIDISANKATAKGSNDAYGGAIASFSGVTITNNQAATTLSAEANNRHGIVFEGNSVSSVTGSAYGGAIAASNQEFSKIGLDQETANQQLPNFVTMSNNGDISFTSNSAEGKIARGGAIYSNGEVTITNNKNVNFSDNNIYGTSDYSNYSAQGGAIYAKGIITISQNKVLSVSNNTADSNQTTTYGGAIYGASDIYIDENESVTFHGNTAKVNTSYGGSGGAIHSEGSTNMFNNGDIAFTENKIESTFSGGGLAYQAEGGAIYAKYNVSIGDEGRGNGNVSFIGNESTNSSSGETHGGAITVGSLSSSDYSASLQITHNKNVTFENNKTSGGRTAEGGAVYVDGTSAYVEIANNDGSVTFKNNSAISTGEIGSSGGAIHTVHDVDYSATVGIYSNKGDVIFDGNQVIAHDNIAMGGAIATGGAILIGDNDNVSIINNTVYNYADYEDDTDGRLAWGGAFTAFSGTSHLSYNRGEVNVSNNGVAVNQYVNSGTVLSVAMGGAMLANGLSIVGNGGDVTFAGNYEYTPHSTVLRSLVILDGALELAAANGKSISFYDAVYVSAGNDVILNFYQDLLDGNVKASTGDIVFSGARTEQDLAAAQATLQKAGFEVSPVDIEASRTSIIERHVNVATGGLRVEDGAVLKLHDGSKGYDLILVNGKEMGPQVGIEFKPELSARLEVSSGSRIEAANIDLGATAIYTSKVGLMQATTLSLKEASIPAAELQAATVTLHAGMTYNQDGAITLLVGDANTLVLDATNGESFIFNVDESLAYTQDENIYFVLFTGVEDLSLKGIESLDKLLFMHNLEQYNDIALGFHDDTGTLYLSAKSNSIPEPATATLSLLALAALAARRRRR